MRSGPAVVRSIGPLFIAAIFPLAATLPARGSAATIDPPAVPAAGRATATLMVAEPGRYAIMAASAAGAGLQLVDRQAGLGELSGAAGERDGRVDLLLDRGAYRLVTRGPEKAAGEVRLEARRFVDPEPGRQRLLVEGKAVAAALGDFEQRSWWLRVEDRRRVILEAAGRNLGDLRLFDVGGWLVDAAPVRETIEPEPGRPVRSCRIVATLEPGMYLLSAFGGPDEPWPAGGDGHPLHLRFGIPSLGETGRTRYRVGPFGADHFVVPGNVTFVQLELPEATAARLEEAPFPADGDPFGGPRTSADITKKHREPVAVLEPGAQDQPRLITVRAGAGQPYVLQHFELRSGYSFKLSGRHWVGSVHSGHPQDSADATAIVTSLASPTRRGIEPFLAQAVEIGADRGWARRCNLLETLTVFFRVRETGSYEVLLRGDAAARARFEPFLVTRPRDYREPDLQPSGSTWQLEAGWYVLTLVPDRPGIVEAAVRPAGRLDAIWDLLDPGRPMRGDPVRPAVTFPAADLDWDNRYTVHLNRRPGVRTGLVVRRLPVDLAEPLPLALIPGEEVAVEARAGEAGIIRAESEAGESLDVRADAGAWLKALDVSAGTFEVRVRNSGAQSVIAALRFEPKRLRPDAPLPEVPSEALRPPPALPTLTEDQPRFLDLEERGTASYNVRVAEPAFQTIESTGLLSTTGTLRSRFIPHLDAASGGGTGRNFLIGGYLREGDYRLTVSAQGASSGHLGVRLRRAPLRDGGALTLGSPSRITVGPAEGVLYTFEIPEAGTYRLNAFSAGQPVPFSATQPPTYVADRYFAYRLEDADGWPIEPPGRPARDLRERDYERDFEPGGYRLLLLPEAVGSRRVTLLERVAEPLRFEGHGPHPLEFDRPVEHVWVEPPGGGGAERTPDRWTFVLPAPATLHVTLTGEMQGELRAIAAGSPISPLAVRIPPGRAWSGNLPAGSYVLEAVCSRRNNHNPYKIAVRAEELLAGTSRDVETPATIAVSVGNAGLFEFSTTGSADVQARLVDAAGAVIAEQEDRPDDWNVQLAARLAPGAYRLELAPTGADGADTRVAMRAIVERDEPALALPSSREVRPGDDVAVIPLAVPEGAVLLTVRARAGETVGVAVDRASGTEWATLWSGLDRDHAVEVPLGAATPGGPNTRFRLRVWSLDRRGGVVGVAVAAVAPQRVGERELSDGATVEAVPGSDPPLAVAEIALDRPGLLRLDDATPWRASGVALAPLKPAGAVQAAARGTLWVAADLPPGTRQAVLAGARVVLTADEPLTVELPADGTPISCDLDARGSGPLMVTATATTGRAAAAIVPRDTPVPARVAAVAGATRGEGAAAALKPEPEPGRTVALVWSADPGRPASQATLRLLEFSERDAPGPAPAAGGTLEPGAAARFTLPRGDKRLRLSLGPGLAAALGDGSRVESAHAAGEAALSESLETAAEQLTIVNAGASPASWSLELLPLDARDRTPAIASATPFVREFAAAGTVWVAVAPDDGAGAPLRLRVAGADAVPTYLAADGRVAAGTDLAVGPGGMLLLAHGRGLVAAWVDHPGETASGLWGNAPQPRERTVEAGGVIRLEGPSTGLAVNVATPSVLHLSTDGPVIGLVRPPAGAAQNLLHLRAATLELFLSPGATTIWLRPARGGELRGSAEVLLAPVTPIGEGPGPHVLLAPGAAHYFSFNVTREGPLGVGVRATPDTAVCRLLDAAGGVLGEGVVQMPRLAPGAYLLAVRAPADGGPVTVRPALAGLVPPDTGPPEDVVRRYLQLRDSADDGVATPRPDTPDHQEGD